jgi:uncharacterized protein YdeI (YjbR/CyaY-like superfamily)
MTDSAALPARDPRVDAYIARSAEFARPILVHLREVVHAACPRVTETIKWGFPHFMYEGMLCSMAAFKRHCAFGFWKGTLIVEDGERDDDAMGHFGRIARVEDLPPKRRLAALVKAAMKLNETGVRGVRRPRQPKRKRVVTPAWFTAALARHARAKQGYAALTASQRREYVEWLADAKREDTREKRLATALEWLADGKDLNWKYRRSG